MEIHHLRYFLAVAQNLSFTKAAEHLFTSKAPVSRHVQALEKEIGSALFDRSSRKVVLTAEGKRLIPLATALVHAFDSLSEEIRKNDDATLPPVVRFAVHNLLRTPTQKALLDMIDQFSGQYSFHVQQIPSLEMRQRLLNNSVDIAMPRLSVTPPGLQSLTLKSEQATVLVHVSAFPGRTSLRIEDLRGLTCIRVPPQLGIPELRQAERLFLEAGAKDGGTAEYSAIDGQILALNSKDVFSLTLIGSDELKARPNGSEYTLLPVEGLDLDLSIVLAWRECDDQFAEVASKIANVLK